MTRIQYVLSLVATLCVALTINACVPAASPGDPDGAVVTILPDGAINDPVAGTSCAGIPTGRYDCTYPCWSRGVRVCTPDGIWSRCVPDRDLGAVPTCDSGVPLADAGMSSDAGTVGTDSGVPADAGPSPGTDAGITPGTDAGPVRVGCPCTDPRVLYDCVTVCLNPGRQSCEQYCDWGYCRPDIVELEDCPAAMSDAGMPGTDAGPPPVDAGSGSTDAGSAGVDAGPVAMDAGPPPADAGMMSGSDAGPVAPSGIVMTRVMSSSTLCPSGGSPELHIWDNTPNADWPGWSPLMVPVTGSSTGSGVYTNATPINASIFCVGGGVYEVSSALRSATIGSSGAPFATIRINGVLVPTFICWDTVPGSRGDDRFRRIQFAATSDSSLFPAGCSVGTGP